MQACTSSGWPPSARVLFTRPSGGMMTSILTFPATFMRLASSGYVGETLVLTLRLPSSTEDDCPRACNPRIDDNAIPATIFRIQLGLIDTNPPLDGVPRH